MTNKKAFFLFFASAIVAGGILLLNEDKFYIYNDLIEPLIWGLLFLIPIFFILIFLRKEIFNIWKKFAIIYILIAAALIIIFPKSCGFMCFDRELATIWLGAIYVIVSLIIIIRKSIKLRKEKIAPIQKKP